MVRSYHHLSPTYLNAMLMCDELPVVDNASGKGRAIIALWAKRVIRREVMLWTKKHLQLKT